MLHGDLAVQERYLLKHIVKHAEFRVSFCQSLIGFAEPADCLHEPIVRSVDLAVRHGHACLRYIQLPIGGHELPIGFGELGIHVGELSVRHAQLGVRGR